MEQEEDLTHTRNCASPEFPLSCHRELTQVISFPAEEGQCAEDVVCATVRILPHVTTGEKKCSSMIQVKNAVDFTWEDKIHAGQLVAVHKSGRIIAYALNGTNQSTDGVVRIATTAPGSGRLLAKGMKGPIQDLSFADFDAEILLAIVDEVGNLFVYKIHEGPKELTKRLIFQVTHDILPRKNCGHQVVWIPYLPEGLDEDASHNCKLLTLILGSKAELWDVSLRYEGEEAVLPENVTEGFQLIKGHTDIITGATFSPDGTAVATISLDGTMKFFQVYFHEPPRCLHNWKPHDGKPLSCVFFLDDHKSDNNECQFWKFVVTGTEGNAELKVWDCKAWSLIQTISLLNDGGISHLKASIDRSASFLLLSDQINQVLYLFRVVVEKDDSIAYLNAVSTYIVPFPILSFTIVDASTGYVKRNSFGVDDFQEDDEDSDEDELERATILSLYIVNPKSLQECQLQLLSPPDGSLLTYSTLVPNQTKPPMPINLLTPKEFTSPAKPPDEPETLAPKEPDLTDAMVSGASSPSREVRDILSSHGEKGDDEAAAGVVESVILPEEPKKEWFMTPHLPKRTPPSPESIEVIREMISPSNKRAPLGKSEVVIDHIAGGGDLDSNEVSNKLDSIITILKNQELMLKNQESEIKDLKKKIRDMGQDSSKIEERFDRTMAAHSAKIQDNFARMDSQDRDRQEAMLYSVSQAIGNIIAVKLEEIIPLEMSKNVLPEILRDLEPFKHNLHVEMTQQLSATDHLLKENISKLVHSKSVLEVLSMSLASVMKNSVAEIFKDLLGNFVIPRLEKVLEKTFQQVHDTFANGTHECVASIKEEVSRLNDSLRKTEHGLIMASELNKNSAHLFHGEIEKTVLTVGDKLKKQMAETIQKEMVAGKALLECAINSRAVTPGIGVVDKQTTVSQLIASGHINAAFQEALSASDLDLVVYVCRLLTPDAVFSETPCPLEQPVLLSLVQQLSADMANQTELKCGYLTEAVLCLEQNHPTTKEHLPVVITDVQRQINAYLASHPGSKYCRAMQRILMVIKILSRGK